ncbi:MAG TPA: hypothetical protein P5277_01825 [Candidatus Paceibacterota bacterium]|nr:hypothetical protein [Candidatus Paceibacterota bacterium]
MKNFGNNRSGGFNRGFNRGFSSGPKEMHKATCSECGKECEVPFKPSNDSEGKPRPVYCKECYAKKKPRY